MTDGQTLHELVGLMSELKEKRRQRAVEQDAQGQEPGREGLRLATWSLMRSHGYLVACLRHQRSRLGAPKAITATTHDATAAPAEPLLQ